MIADILMLGSSGFVIVYMGYLLQKRKRIRQKGHNATGEIIDFKDTGEDAYPIIRFTTLAGESIEKKYKVTQGEKASIGDKLPLYYNPDKPSEFFVAKVREERALILMMVFGVIFAAAYLIFFRQN
jgi:hypothetical protein